MIILIIHIIVSCDQNISLIFFYVKDGSHVRLWHPSCVYITAQRQYIAVQKMRTSSEIAFLALHSCLAVSFMYNFLTMSCNNIMILEYLRTAFFPFQEVSTKSEQSNYEISHNPRKGLKISSFRNPQKNRKSVNFISLLLSRKCRSNI